MISFNNDMCFWILEPKKNAPWPRHEPTMAVVVASDELEAREIAAQESSTIWLDRYNSDCVTFEAQVCTKPEVICDSIPCPGEDLLEVTDAYSASVIAKWMKFLNRESQESLDETDIADLLMALKEIRWI